MKYITKKESATGKKFQEVGNKIITALNEAKQVSVKYGFNQYRGSSYYETGGISSCLDFKETPDPKIWGKGAQHMEFMPKRNSKIGRAISEEIKQLPTVSRDELNQCIGFDGAPFKVIGFAFNNETHFGFIVNEEWNVKIPDDCEEVTTSTYNSLFKK